MNNIKTTNNIKMNKRSRSINWDEEEKQLFRLVLKEYAEVIENKCLDTNTSKLKTKAWEEVHKKFNALNSRKREIPQLKIQWKAMKINARKTCSTFKNETTKTGGGARPTSPSNSIIEVKDLLNPAELLIDHNEYDSDGIKLWEFETIEDVDAQVDVQDLTPIVITQDDNDIIAATPINKTINTIPAKKVPKRKILSNNIPENGIKSKTDHDDYVSSMLSHSKKLKDEEHLRRMEMAEQEHAINMEILKEQLKFAILNREILELKKVRELEK